MKSFIIDPAKKSFEEIELPNGEKHRLKKIAELLGTDEYNITFIYPPKRGAPFFRVKGFVDKVKFGKTVVIDQTATGVPKSDNITLADLKPLVTFFP